MKKLTTLLAILSLFSGTEIIAQNLNTHYLYQMNWFNINPAYTGSANGTKVMINPGTQWVGLDGNPTNSMFGIHTKIRNNMGLGGKFVIDKRGIFSNLTAELAYSYQVKLDDKQQLTFGITAGLYQANLDRVGILEDRYTDNSDPTISSEYYNSNNLVSSFGALYQFNELELGLSAPHLIVAGRPLSDHVFGMAKYNFFFKEDKIKVTPHLVYQNLTRSPNQMDIGVKGTWDELVWAQATYKTNKTIVAAAGVDIKKFNIGYAYIINTAALSVISTGSHELYLGFTFGDKRKFGKNGEFLDGNDKNTKQQEKFQSILNDLRVISEKENTPVDKAEINKIQAELIQLIKKAKTEQFTKEDEKRMLDLEKQLKNLKTKLGY